MKAHITTTQKVTALGLAGLLAFTPFAFGFTAAHGYEDTPESVSQTSESDFMNITNKQSGIIQKQNDGNYIADNIYIINIANDGVTETKYTITLDNLETGERIWTDTKTGTNIDVELPYYDIQPFTQYLVTITAETDTITETKTIDLMHFNGSLLVTRESLNDYDLVNMQSFTVESFYKGQEIQWWITDDQANQVASGVVYAGETVDVSEITERLDDGRYEFLVRFNWTTRLGLSGQTGQGSPLTIVHPDVTITKDSDINPQEISFAQKYDDSTLEWTIKNSDNDIILSGTKDDVLTSDILKSLDSGKYTVTATETSALNPQDTKTESFTIALSDVNVTIDSNENPTIVEITSSSDNNDTEWEIVDSEGNVVLNGTGTAQITDELATLPEGEYTVIAKETDSYGNVSEDSKTFVIKTPVVIDPPVTPEPTDPGTSTPGDSGSTQDDSNIDDSGKSTGVASDTKTPTVNSVEKPTSVETPTKTHDAIDNTQDVKADSLALTGANVSTPIMITAGLLLAGIVGLVIRKRLA